MNNQSPSQDFNMSEPIAIVGIGCMFPKAPNLNTYWRNIKTAQDAMMDVPESHWNPDDYFDPDPATPDMTYARRGGFLDPVDFNPLYYGIAPNTIEAIDSTQLLALVAAEQALADAGYAVRQDSSSGRGFDRSRTSVMLGVTGTLELVIPLGARLGHPRWRKAMLDAGIPADTTEEIISRIAGGYVPWQEQSFPGLLGNVTAGRIANRLDLGGANCVVDAACASSISAIHMAVMELMLGRCDMAISGGIDTFNDIFMYMCFSKTPALSASGNARPFSADADGTMLGEGVGVLVLKRLSDARRDGDQIRAVIKGIGASSDGAGNAIYAPSSSGQARALRAAYREANVRPQTIELVEAHGTGTHVGDQVEADALSAVFSEDVQDLVCEQASSHTPDENKSWCALGSVKSMIGHTKAAAGVAGIIKTVMALEHKVLPPTLKVSQPLDSLTPGQSPIYLNTSTRPWISKSTHPRRAAVSAFGFGGSNFHCVLEEAHAAKTVPDWDGNLQLVAFSGQNREAILEQLTSFWQAVKSSQGSSWGVVRNLAKQSREQFSASAPCRLVFLLRPEYLAEESLFEEIELLPFQQKSASQLTKGFYGEGKPSGRLGVVFPGQGSQRINMLKDLSCLFPSMLVRWEQVNNSLDLGPLADPVRISEYVYPLPVFDPDQIIRQREALRATCIAQPALAAASLGILDILSAFGLQAEAFAGHSFGEFIALFAAGVISDEALLRLARQRGECMERSCQQIPGGMLAVNAQVADVEAILKTESLALAIANYNSPTQLVLSGAYPELDKARAVFSARGLHSVLLNVAGAFHSSLMAEARDRFADSLDQTKFSLPIHQVYSNVSAGPYPQDAAEIISLLSSQITAPIRFVDMIRNMYDEGIHTFIEAGPGKVLRTLIGAILADHTHKVIALDASCGNGKELDDLGLSLAQLAADGYAVDLRQWDPNPPVVQQQHGFSIQISGANHFEPKELPAMQYPLASLKPSVTMAGEQRSLPTAPSSHDSTPPETNLEFVQSALLALQKMQQETSELHRQYLEGQQSAQRSIEILLRQQMRAVGVEPEHSEIGVPSKPAKMPNPSTASLKLTSVPPASMPEALSGTVRTSETIAPLSNGMARTVLLDIVAEKTGYPREVLTPKMSLDKDLGIDSIKRVEILSALSERFPTLAALSAAEAGSLDTLEQIEARLSDSLDERSIPDTVPTGSLHTQYFSAANSQEHSEIAAAIVSVIADKTGYPTEALNSAMRMDEDLGIDSIKRVEIFSTLQERFPTSLVVEPDAMARLRSIGDIIEYLGRGLSQPRNGKASVNGKHFTNENHSGNGSVSRHSRNGEETLSHITQMELPVGRGSLDGGLHRLVLKSTAGVLQERKPLHISKDAVIGIYADGTDLGDALQDAFKQRGIVSKLIYVDQKQAIASLSGLLIVSPQEVHADTLTNMFSLIRECGPRLQQAGTHAPALLASVSRLDGQFGLSPQTIEQPLSAGLGGIIKTAAREWPHVKCKSIDIGKNWGAPQELAEAIVAEMLLDGPLEVGLSGRDQIVLELVPQDIPVADFRDGPLIHSKDLVLVSGGARGISAAVAIALARRYQPTLLLLGRSPEPIPEADWLQGVNGEGAIKRAIHEHHGGAKSPKEIELLFQQIMANREMVENLATIKSCGSHVLYRSVNVCRREETIQVLKACMAEFGPLRGVIHGAGILADGLIADKTEAQFQAVLSTKCDGFMNLMACVNGQDPAFIVACSSTTARLGRRGQADYAAANECLNKLAQEVAKQYTKSKVLSVNWGPWDGGMVDTRLKKMFHNEGVGLIPLDAGAEYLIQELQSAPSADVELVVLGPTPSETPTEGSPLQLCFSQEVSLASIPILSSHVFNNRAVVPVALIIEWLAHGALQASPGLRFVGLEDFRVFKGVTIDATQSKKIRVLAGLANGEFTKRGRREVLIVEVRSDDMLHARAHVHLAEEFPIVADSGLAGVRLAYSRQPYEDSRLFHGIDLQGLTHIHGCDDQGISGETRTAPAPNVWIKDPLRAEWLADPLVLDASFQMMILWSEHLYQHGSLPTAIGRLELYAPFPSTSPVGIEAQIQAHQPHKAIANIDFRDSQNCLIAHIEKYECVIDVSLNAGFARNSLASHS